MLRKISLALVALVGLSTAVAAQTLTLPEIGIQNTGACRQLSVRNRTNAAQVPMGCVDTGTNGFRSTPNALTLPSTADAMSGGDVSPFSSRPAWVGAFARKLSDIVGDRVEVKTFGAVCDGGSHPLSASYLTLTLAQRDYPAATSGAQEKDEVAIKQAIAVVAASGGGTVNLPAGTCRTTDEILLQGINNVHIRGKGKGSSFIALNSPNANNFTIRNSAYTSIRDLTLNTASGQPRSAGSAIATISASETNISSVQIYSQNTALTFIDSVSQWLDDISIYGMQPNTGVGIDIFGGNDQYINRVFIRGLGPVNQPYAALTVRKTGGLWLTNNGGLWTGGGLIINPAPGDIVEHVFSTMNAYDTGTSNGILIQPAAPTDSFPAGGTARRLQFVQDWTSTMSAHGVAVVGAGTVDGVRFTSHRAVQNALNGFLINGGTNVSVNDSDILGNGGSAPGSYDGVSVTANTGSFSIINNRIGGFGGYGATQGYGIRVAVGASDNYRIGLNDLRNNITGALFDGGTGTHKFIGGNLPQIGWTPYSPTVTAGTGTLGSYSTVSFYNVTDTTMALRVNITIPTNGSGAGGINFTLPRTLAGACVLAGRSASGGPMLQAVGEAGQTQMATMTYNNIYPGGDNARLYLSGTCEIAP